MDGVVPRPPPIPPRTPQNYPPLANKNHSGGSSSSSSSSAGLGLSRGASPPAIPARPSGTTGSYVGGGATSTTPPIPAHAVSRSYGSFSSPHSPPATPVGASASTATTPSHASASSASAEAVMEDGRTGTEALLQKRAGTIVELKMVLMGQVNTGKTRLLNRILASFRGSAAGAGDLVGGDTMRQAATGAGNESGGEESEEDTQPTVGAAYLVKLINLYGTNVKCSLWDLSGAEHFVDKLGHMFYRGAHVVIFVFDVTDIASFIYAKKLIEEVTSDNNHNTAEPILVGTKCDKPTERQIQEGEVRPWAEGKRISYYEASALWPSDKMQVLFRNMVESGLKKMLDSPTSPISAPQATSLPEWVPDSSGNSCTSCGAYFHFALRRHHCRRCGFIFCGPCTTQKVVLPACGPRPVRVCDVCYHDALKLNH